MWFVLACSVNAQVPVALLSPTIEPGELSGSDAKAATISETDKPYADAFVDLLKDLKMKPADLPKLNAFIQRYPKNDIAYYWRATISACASQPPNLGEAESDLERYASKAHSDLFSSQETEALALEAKIQAAGGHPLEALALLKKAANKDLSKADRLFNQSDAKPLTTSEFCEWNLTDLNQLASAAPHDAWPQILIGLYYRFFATFNESYYAPAAAAFRKAAVLDSRSALIPYLQGELYNSATLLVRRSWADGADKAGESAQTMFTKAITKDPGFAPAYGSRAEVYLNTKRPALAVKDFDKALSLDPNNNAYHTDRGIAESDLGNYYAAISDFGDSLVAKDENDIYLPQLYQNRADAYVKVHDLRRAVGDYTASIHLRLKSQIAVLSLQQFRSLYPEYGTVTDDALLDKLNRYFMPNFAPDVFKKMIRDNEEKKWTPSMMSDLYESRGDAYLQLGDYARGIRDFQRIYRALPAFGDSTDRWRNLGTVGNGETLALDVKGSDVAPDHQPRIWLKRSGPKESRVIAFAVDCTSRKVRTTSSVAYDAKGDSIGGDSGGTWDEITPDTIGEQVWTGVCEPKP